MYLRHNRIKAFSVPTLLALLCALFLTACATHTSLPVLDVSRNNIGVDAVYRLGIGDELKIKVFGEPELSGRFQVDAGGNVPFPLIGNIHADGVSVGQFNRRLKKKLSNGFLKHPRVTVDITNYRPIFVHGEVRKGGQHTFKAGLKLRDIVALAGGYTYRADESFVVLNRANSRQAVRVFLPSDLNILPGDNIRVPERFF